MESGTGDAYQSMLQLELTARNGAGELSDVNKAKDDGYLHGGAGNSITSPLKRDIKYGTEREESSAVASAAHRDKSCSHSLCE